MDTVQCICGGKHKGYNKSIHNKTIKHITFINQVSDYNNSIKIIEERLNKVELSLDEIKEKTINGC